MLLWIRFGRSILSFVLDEEETVLMVLIVVLTVLSERLRWRGWLLASRIACIGSNTRDGFERFCFMLHILIQLKTKTAFESSAFVTE